MRFLLNPSTDPYFNMAFDEYCLEHYSSDAPFFYLWRNAPSVIIGLNQNACAEVNLSYLESRDIKLARRVTGGGAVYHDLQNMNYTIIGRNVTPAPFVDALRSLGVPAELSGRNDIIVDGRKVSGYARRLSNNREIVHGTMMYDVDIDTLTKALDVPGSKLSSKGVASVRSRVANLKDYLPQFSSLDDVQVAIQCVMADGNSCMEFGRDRIDEVKRMAAEKFSTWEWIFGHSREAQVTHSAKMQCGTVEVHLCLDGGVLREVTFTGDFIGDRSVERISSLLKDTKYDIRSVQDALSGVDVSDYFPGTDASSLADLVMGK
ncbi:MAG TPA: lipoate--protein ligase [Rikenellaceae bacterium]|nr:lipoate--protein ligase [Rikenellaceae bacterium]